MIRYTKDELNDILKAHEKWLAGVEGGIRADLSYTELSGADLSHVELSCACLNHANIGHASLNHANLHGADLIEVDLHGSDLRCADLSGAYLNYSDLRYANLRDANLDNAVLSHADLNIANLSKANLNRAYLEYANLIGANLGYATLIGANLGHANCCHVNLSHADLSRVGFDYTDLYDANIDSCLNMPFIPMACPEEGSFIGYKKASGLIVKLEILSDAKRSSAFSRKCRCDKARVIEIQTLSGDKANVDSVNSDYNQSVVYTVGEIVKVDNFDENRFNECSTGIHFFINRQEAVEY